MSKSTVDSDSSDTRQDVKLIDDHASQGLQELGYKQEFSRSRGTFHLLFMILAIMAVPFALTAPLATGLIEGGPVAIVWGWILVSILSNALMFSMGELASKYPTSAGAYYWVYRLSPPRYRLLLSWINGWISMVGVWMICLSATFGTAQILVAGVGIYYPEWVATTWQTYLVFVAVTIWAGVFIVFFNRILPTFDVIAAAWSAVGILIILVCLSIKAASGRRSASFVFTHFDSSASGWTPGWSFFIGLLPAAFTFTANGMIASMAEEVHNPSHQLPRALSWSPLVGSIFGILFLLPLTFTLPDVATLLAVPGGQPIAVMFELVMGSKAGGVTMWFIVFGAGMLCTISICCAASRATWSFARDKAIPFHEVFGRINRNFDNAPVNAHLLATGIQLLLGLIYLGSSAAFNAFSGVAIICLQASFTMPVAILLASGRKHMADAPFNLGRWGFVMNAVAVLWTLLQLVLFSVPAVLPVTPVTMNYASVVGVGFAAISAIWYLVYGRYHYAGPPMPEDGTR